MKPRSWRASWCETAWAETVWTTSTSCAPTRLASIWGHALPSPEAARNFLYEFQEESRIDDAKQQCTLLGTKAYIPGENAALSGLGLVNREVAQEVGRRCPEQRIATVDQDATIIESRKQEALRGY